MKASPPLRMGIMCSGTTFEEWQTRCLKNILAPGNAQPVLLIIDDTKASPPTMFSKIKFGFANLDRSLFLIYSLFFCHPRAIHPVDMAKFFSRVPAIHCSVIKRGKFSQYFSEADIETIRRYNLDFILRFGFGIIRGEILRVARYGVWSFHHGDEKKYRGGPPCFWEIYKGDNVTAAILQRLTDRLDGGIVLKKGFFPTVRHSYAKNVEQSYHESAKWPAQVCIDICNGVADYLDTPPSQTKAPVYYRPNNLHMLSFTIKILSNRITQIWEALFRHGQWNVGIVYAPIHTFLEAGARPKIHWFATPKRSKFLADPFGIARKTGITVLCEDFDYCSRKGSICSINLLDESFSCNSTPAIASPFHMSYPYLFEHQGEIYCIPETSAAREISLYKAREFPDKWTRIATLIPDIAGVDATVFQYEGFWWLTCTERQQSSDLNLLVWYAPSLFGPWKPHAGNPVKTDVCSVRPAGTPFLHNGCLYRPAQDCSKTYGGRVVINRVTRLTPTEFREEQVGAIEPYADSPFPNGLHTVSSVGNFTLIDGKRRIFVPSQFKYTLTREIYNTWRRLA